MEEASHPVETSLIIGASRGDEVVTRVLQRVDILLPERSTIRGAHVGLTGFVGPEKSELSKSVPKIGLWDTLVHAKDIFGVTGNNQALEVGNLIITPQHGNPFKAIEVSGQVRAPSVEAVL